MTTHPSFPTIYELGGIHEAPDGTFTCKLDRSGVIVSGVTQDHLVAACPLFMQMYASLKNCQQIDKAAALRSMQYAVSKNPNDRYIFHGNGLVVAWREWAGTARVARPGKAPMLRDDNGLWWNVSWDQWDTSLSGFKEAYATINELASTDLELTMLLKAYYTAKNDTGVMVTLPDTALYHTAGDVSA